MTKYKSLITSLPLSNLTYANSFDVNTPDREGSEFEPVQSINIFIELPENTTGDIKLKATRKSNESEIPDFFTIRHEFKGDGDGKIWTIKYPVNDLNEKNVNVTFTADKDPLSAFTKRFKIATKLNGSDFTSLQNGSETWAFETLGSGTAPAPDINGICIKSYKTVKRNSTCQPFPIEQISNIPSINSAPGMKAVKPCDGRRPEPPELFIIE